METSINIDYHVTAIFPDDLFHNHLPHTQSILQIKLLDQSKRCSLLQNIKFS